MWVLAVSVSAGSKTIPFVQATLHLLYVYNCQDMGHGSRSAEKVRGSLGAEDPTTKRAQAVHSFEPAR